MEDKPSAWTVFINRLFDVFEQNLMISSFIALAMVSAACYMWVSQIPIPKGLEAVLAMVLGYFLGAKAQGVARRRSERKSV